MFSIEVLNQVERVWKEGGNITNFLKKLEQNTHNSKEAILISYEYQSGTYVEGYKKDPKNINTYARQLSEEIKLLGGDIETILECGVGEATTFSQVTGNLNVPLENCYGFDISWSRLKVGMDFLKENIKDNPKFFVADFSSIPLCDNSIRI